jgi:hypothetical protein
MTPCRLVHRYQRFEGDLCFYLQEKSIGVNVMVECTILCIVYHDSEGSNILLSDFKDNMAVFKEIGCENE